MAWGTTAVSSGRTPQGMGQREGVVPAKCVVPAMPVLGCCHRGLCAMANGRPS